ncbi:hypothetical protein [Bradyrhizobium genosp. P]|uniref:hypothetical protein n=1 Tax=Bradyrhizobium genosp. P TaxID=83641 RepID=UPI003CF8FF86
MSDVRFSMGVSFNAMACHKHDLALWALAEIVLVIGGDRYDGTFKGWRGLREYAPERGQVFSESLHHIPDAVGRREMCRAVVFTK